MKRPMKKKTRVLTAASIGLVLSLVLVDHPRADEFYEGKTVTIVQGRDPGGTGDMRVRALLPFLEKYIPGHPTIVNEYMPGGGSRKA
ncbi:MAG: Bug family tripartite tricarboxylate transporter substrate binding protein, partial [Candidatus Binatia bacterium]